MDPIDRNAVKILSIASSNISTTDAISAVMSIWLGNIPLEEMELIQTGGADDFSLIAEHEGHLVGFALCRLAYVGLPLVRVCIIHSIAVKPDYQKQGIGTLMIEKLRSNCKAKGINTVRALIPASNSRLGKYCEELGFRPSTTLNFDISAL